MARARSCPSPDTIRTGTYQPLSRPVFIYVSKKAAERPEVQKFVEFYLKNAEKLVREVNYVGLGDAAYTLVAIASPSERSARCSPARTRSA